MMGLLLYAAAAIAAPEPLIAEMQRVEESRNAAIKAGDMEALRELYAEGFQGIASGGARVDRETLLAVFQRNAGRDFIAESTILSAREVEGLVIVEGRLKLFAADRSRLLSDSSTCMSSAAALAVGRWSAERPRPYPRPRHDRHPKSRVASRVTAC